MDLRVLSCSANMACMYKQDTWSLWISSSSLLREYTTIANHRNPLASFPAWKSDELAEKPVLAFLLPRVSMKFPGLRVLWGGKSTHPFKPPEAHLVNEYWRCCGIESQRAIGVSRALLKTAARMQERACQHCRPGCVERRVNCPPISSSVGAILVMTSVENHLLKRRDNYNNILHACFFLSWR